MGNFILKAQVTAPLVTLIRKMVKLHAKLRFEGKEKKTHAIISNKKWLNMVSIKIKDSQQTEKSKSVQQRLRYPDIQCLCKVQ